MINTKRVAGRVTLRFDDLDEILAYCETLVERGTTQLGIWSLGENRKQSALYLTLTDARDSRNRV